MHCSIIEKGGENDEEIAKIFTTYLQKNRFWGGSFNFSFNSIWFELPVDSQVEMSHGYLDMW